MDRKIPQKMVIKSEKGHKVDEKISRNSHLIFDRDAILHIFSGLGRPLLI